MIRQELIDRVFAAMGHCFPCDEFEEAEVSGLASAMGVNQAIAWSAYNKARDEAKDALLAPWRADGMSQEIFAVAVHRDRHPGFQGLMVRAVGSLEQMRRLVGRYPGSACYPLWFNDFTFETVEYAVFKAEFDQDDQGEIVRAVRCASEAA